MTYFAAGIPGPSADLYLLASPRPAAGVIGYIIRQFPRERKALFLKLRGGQQIDAWWPVGGTLEAAEEPLQPALRELFEATGPGKALAIFVAYVDETTPVTLNDEHCYYLLLPVLTCE